MTETLSLNPDLGPEPGSYPMILTDLVPFTYVKDGVPETLLRWTFRASDQTGIDGVSSLNTGPRSKAFAWQSALLGRVPGRKDKLGDWSRDPASGVWSGDSPLVGLPCLVSVAAGADGYSKIDNVSPPLKVK